MRAVVARLLGVVVAATLSVELACSGDDAGGGGAPTGGSGGQGGQPTGGSGGVGAVPADASDVEADAPTESADGSGGTAPDAEDASGPDVLDEADAGADAEDASDADEANDGADADDADDADQDADDADQDADDADQDADDGSTEAASDASDEADAPFVCQPASCPPPTGDCEQAVCLANACGFAPKTVGTPCGAGGLCNGVGQCGVCLPGSKQCSGDTPILCDSVGQWQAASPCVAPTSSCQDGACDLPTPASCATLPKTCGPAASGSCCATQLVPGETFSRGYDGVTYTDPSQLATVSGYRLELYEVTVGRFRAFVDAGAGTQSSPPAPGSGAHPAIAGSGWSASYDSKLPATTAALRSALACHAAYATWTDVAQSNESRPINCVSWYEAFAFCAWDGSALPTEAEWNLASAGGAEQRVYPWSSPPTSVTVTAGHASYYVNAMEQCMGDGVAGCSLADLVPVGSKPLGLARHGHYELSGNVWEWVLDAYSNPFAINPCNDCAVLNGSSLRVIRGGSFFGSPSTILSSSRSSAAPDQHLFSVGLRCARPS